MSSFETIERALDKFENGFNSKFEEVSIKNKELADEILQLKQRGVMQHGYDGLQTNGKTMGENVSVLFDQNAEMFFKTGNMNLKLDVKSITSAVSGMVGQYAPIATPSMTQSSLISALSIRSQPGLATLNYVRMTDRGVKPAVQTAEGAQKAETTPTFTKVTQNAITIAGYTVLSEQALKTQGELSRVIDVHLKNQLLRSLDTLVIDGTAAAAWPFGGLEALSGTYISATYTLLHDAIIDAATNMRASGYEPDVICLNPMEFLGIALKKDTAGQYLTGAYMGELPQKLHGMRVTFSSDVALGKALVLDSRYVEILMTDDANVQFGYNNDDFVRNLVTARVECSVIPVVRDLQAMNLVSPKV